MFDASCQGTSPIQRQERTMPILSQYAENVMLIMKKRKKIWGLFVCLVATNCWGSSVWTVLGLEVLWTSGIS